jgi:hypothetical protein
MWPWSLRPHPGHGAGRSQVVLQVMALQGPCWKLSLEMGVPEASPGCFRAGGEAGWAASVGLAAVWFSVTGSLFPKP